MTKRTYQLFFGIGAGMSILCLFFDYRYSYSILIGMLASYVSHLLLVWHTTDYLKNTAANGWGFGLFFILRLAIQCLALLVYFLFPDYVKLLGVLIGLLLMKICIFIDEFLTRRGMA